MSNGKGSKSRISNKRLFDSNWESIFGVKKTKEKSEKNTKIKELTANNDKFIEISKV
jgi:hypothetical protein